jgi:hypothetical protein
MLQRGLEGSSPLMGLSFWRTGIIAAETADGAVSLVGSERPPMEWCSGRRCARKIVGFLKGIDRALAAAERHPVGRQSIKLGVRPLPPRTHRQRMCATIGANTLDPPDR